MNTRDSYCFICGIALSRCKKLQFKQYAWMDDLTLLLPYINRALSGFKQLDTEIFCNEETQTFFNTTDLPGYICHTECWSYVSKTHNKDLDFEAVRDVKINPYRKYLANKRKYDPADRYYGNKFFLEDKKILAYHKFILRSPFKNKQNADRISKLCKLMHLV